MRAIRQTTQFSKLKEVIERLAGGETLEARYRDHVLSGAYRGARDCHVEPDWLLIYELPEDELVLVRTGTHADLF